MNDADIRCAYHRVRLRRQHLDPRTLVVDELGLQHGASRADIAVINGHMVGIEIKGDSDTLDRLESQVPAYSSVFDQVVLVCTERHVDRAVRYVPSWWGVVCADEGPRHGVRLQTVRAAAPNPEVDPYAVAQLLWRDEAIAILRKRGAAARELRGSRAVLYSEIVDRLGARDLRYEVREALKSRSGWRESAASS